MHVSESPVRSQPTRALACQSGPTRLGCLCAGLLLLFATGEAQAQFRRPAPFQQILVTEWNDANGRLPREIPSDPVTSKKSQRKLKLALESLADQDYATGVTRLQELVDSGDDAFLEPELPDAPAEVDAENPLPDAPPFVPRETLRKAIDDALESLPEAGQATYETQYGPVARALAEAARRGDRTARESLLLRFRHTQAGLEAAYAAALEQLDRGEYGAAAAGFERLITSPSAVAKLGETLVLKLAIARYRNGDTAGAARAIETGLTRPVTLELAERQVQYDPSTTSAQRWLLDTLGALPAAGSDRSRGWLGVGGNARRVTRSAATTPFLGTVGWRADLAIPQITRPEENTFLPTYLNQWVDRIYQVGAASSLPLLPTGQPVIVGDTLIARGLVGLIAVDLVTGRLRWASAETDPLYELLAVRVGPNAVPDRASDEQVLDRAWIDQTSGSLAAGTTQVYTVERRVAQPALAVQNQNPFAPAAPAPSVDESRLTAFDVQSGKVAWRVTNGATALQSPFAEVQFLGPPLVIDDRLYLLGELADEIRLYALDAMSGKLEWSQRLVRVRLGMQFSGGAPHRRRGLSPSFADGVLVCPTDTGAIVAVSLADRALLWQRDYDVVPDKQPLALMNRAFLNPMSGTDGLRAYFDQLGFSDNQALIRGDTVLVAPRSAGKVFALGLRDGLVRWSTPVPGGLAWGGVTDQLAIVITPQGLVALDLATGEPRWPDNVLRTSSPSGRGFLAGDSYYQPTSQGELLVVDVATGSVRERLRTQDGRPLGNLVAFGGVVVSQRPDSISAFHDLDSLEVRVARLLRDEPDNLETRRIQGGLLIAKGELARGIDVLTPLYAAAPQDDRLRETLVDAAMQLLARDFPAERSRMAAVEALLKTDTERLRFQRLVADGYAATGDFAASLDVLIGLSDLHFSPRGLERVASGWEVRPDRIVAGKLVDLFGLANATDRSGLLDRVNARRTALIDRPRQDELRRFLALFSAAVDVDDVRLTLVKQLEGQGDWLEQGHLLRTVISHSSRPEDRITAAVAMLAVVTETGRSRDWHRVLQEIASFAPDELITVDVDAPPITATKALVDWMREEPFGDDNVPVRWPAGEPVVTRREIGAPPAVNAINVNEALLRPIFVPTVGDPGAWFEDVRFLLDRRVQRLVAYNPQGREIWSVGVGLVETLNLESAALFAAGHEAVLWDGSRLIAIDSVGTKERPGPRILWTRNLLDEAVGGGELPASGVTLNTAGGDVSRRVRVDREGRPYFSIAGCDPSVMVYRSGTRLICLDVLTGEPLWRREGVPAGAETHLAGSRVFLTGAAKMTRLYRTVDGQELPVPPGRWQNTLLVRDELAVAINEGPLVDGKPTPRTLAAVDLRTGATAWTTTVPHTALVQPLIGREIAVLGVDGKYLVLSPRDGRVLRTAALRLDFPIRSAVVWRQSERDLVFVNKSVSGVAAPIAFEPRRRFDLNGRLFGVEHVGSPVDSEAESPLANTWALDCPRRKVDLDLPVDLPVLLLTSNVIPASPDQPSPPPHLILVDTRTGSEIETKTDLSTTTIPLGVEGSASRGELTLKFSRMEFTLDYSGGPGGSKPPGSEPPGEKLPELPPEE
jgi:outer membrane protein assembly factor BamB